MNSLESLEQLMATRSWAMVLWGGLALVTLGLMILMGTRWGQARPLSKCVALSLLAREQGRVGALMAGAAAGRGGALVLRGLPGVGKSTLLADSVAGAYIDSLMADTAICA